MTEVGMKFANSHRFSSDGMEEVGDTPLKVEVIETTETPAKKMAGRFLDLVRSGERPGDAAHMLGTTLKEMDKSIAVQEALRELVPYHMKPELRKEMVRMGLNKVFLDNIRSADKDYVKLALDAAKQIGSDPDVGLNAAPAGGVTIDLGSLGDLLSEKISPPTLDIGEKKGDNHG